MASPKMFMLISCDGERFEAAEAAANMSQTVRHMIEDDCADGGIPLPNVDAKTLAKVLEYCNKHAAVAESPEPAASGGAAASSSSSASTGKDYDVDLASFDKAFVDMDKDTLYNLLLASDYLDVKPLLDLTCQKVADMIKGKTPDQIRETFGIKNDFSPEEYEEIQKENQWAFEQ